MEIFIGRRLFPVAVLFVLCLVFTLWLNSEGNRTSLSNYGEEKQEHTTETQLNCKVEDPSNRCPSREPGYVPSLDQLDKLDHRTLEHLYNSYGSNIEVLCNEMIRMGKIGDGGWEVCNDPRFRPKPSCIAYSFGIAGDFSFDDAMQQFYNCNVYSFDPSINKPDHEHAKNVLFFNMGLAGKGVKKEGWLMKTLSEIKEQLGHKNAQIDVLKMDIESSEWHALPTAIEENALQNVTQLLLEYHDRDQSLQGYRMRLKIIHGIRKLGFRIFYAHKNPICVVTSKFVTHPQRTICHELHMVRLPECVGVGD